MFTGIIHNQGLFKGYYHGKKEMAVETPELVPRMEIGDSLSVDGVCLSLVRKEKTALFFDLSLETLEKTTLGSLRPGTKLNLELPVTSQSLLSGHLVTGHVDAAGRVLKVVRRGRGKRLTVSFPSELRPYIIPKGSVAVNGISLTVADLGAAAFDVELIPITLEKTNLGGLKAGDRVNLECDILGKYVYNWVVQGRK
jgi:riboflavin synthase